jgi:hypothetical protein
VHHRTHGHAFEIEQLGWKNDSGAVSSIWSSTSFFPICPSHIRTLCCLFADVATMEEPEEQRPLSFSWGDAESSSVPASHTPAAPAPDAHNVPVSAAKEAETATKRSKAAAV